MRMKSAGSSPAAAKRGATNTPTIATRAIVTTLASFARAANPGECPGTLWGCTQSDKRVRCSNSTTASPAVKHPGIAETTVSSVIQSPFEDDKGNCAYVGVRDGAVLASVKRRWKLCRIEAHSRELTMRVFT